MRSPVCVTLRATFAVSILPMLIRLYWETATQFACLEVIVKPEKERKTEREREDDNTAGCLDNWWMLQIGPC